MSQLKIVYATFVLQFYSHYIFLILFYFYENFITEFRLRELENF